MSKTKPQRGRGLGLQKMRQEIELASQMIRLGAPLGIIVKETALDKQRLSRLYRELMNKKPPGGMLPFSSEWYLGWLPNIHATVFYTAYLFLNICCKVERRQALVNGYQLYLEYATAGRPEGKQERPVLSFSRAWLLLRYVELRLFDLAICRACHGSFLAPTYLARWQFVCGICKPPNRAGPRLADRKQ